MVLDFLSLAEIGKVFFFPVGAGGIFFFCFVYSPELVVVSV